MGRESVTAEQLREAFREINPQTRFEPQFSMEPFDPSSRKFEAVRTIFAVELPPMTEEEKAEARERVTEILERRLAPSQSNFYALATLGEALRTDGFDTRAYGGRGVKQLLCEIYPEDTSAARYDADHSPHHFISLPSLRPYGQPASVRDTRPARPVVRRDCDVDIVDLRRRFEYIITSSIPAPGGWYELVKITPALKARDFDFHDYGFFKLKDLLSALYGEYLEIEERGDAEHPNKKFMRLPDDDTLHLLPTACEHRERPVRERPRDDFRRDTSYGRPAATDHRDAAPRVKTALDKLLDFAFFPGRGDQRGLDVAIAQLAAVARPERWYYGYRDPGTHPLLKNFLTITFERLQYEDSVGGDDPRFQPKIMVKGDFATFNTGLCDPYDEPVYALFKKNERETDNRPWTFMAFVGSNDMGRFDMTGKFGATLPEAAHYYESTAQLSFDNRCSITVPNLDHFIDHCNRLPFNFLNFFGPQYFNYDRRRTPEFYEELAAAIKADPEVLSRMRQQIESAIEKAKKLLRWNYRRAIPIYFPRDKSISLLLPLNLGNASRPNVALVMTQTPSGDYVATTIYTLGMAYAGARLLCGPENDWLRINDISSF
ncbi:MAG: DUF3825 domain-containing protein [Muribaculaceae bacterium]|nr:DUF3825 domain-containing protein [Muribaculaceae bacterium]